MIAMVMGVSASGWAQDIELPVLSPAASVMQRVGLVDLTVTYSSPGKRERTVWGELVPYGEVWRTGANAATALEASGPFTFGGKEVAAGKYAVFSIPGKDEWTVILNQGAEQWGAFEYDQSKDVVRVQVKPEEGPARERLTFLFSDTTDEGTRLDLEWAGVHVAVPIQVDTTKAVKDNIAAYVDGTGDGLARAARYQLDHGDLVSALKLVDLSMGIEQTWYNTWLKADILHQQENHKEAYKLAQKAQELGNAAGDDFFWKDRVGKALAEWKKK